MPVNVPLSSKHHQAPNNAKCLPFVYSVLRGVIGNHIYHPMKRLWKMNVHLLLQSFLKPLCNILWPSQKTQRNFLHASCKMCLQLWKICRGLWSSWVGDVYKNSICIRSIEAGIVLQGRLLQYASLLASCHWQFGFPSKSYFWQRSQ